MAALSVDRIKTSRVVDAGRRPVEARADPAVPPAVVSPSNIYFEIPRPSISKLNMDPELRCRGREWAAVSFVYHRH